MAPNFEQRRFYHETCVGMHKDVRCAKYAIQCPDGEGVIVCRQVFPGVEVSVNNFQAHRCLECYDTGDPFQLDFCCAGRFACEFSHQETCVLEPGSMAAHHADRRGNMESIFPGGHYRGVNLTIDFEQAADFTSRQFGTLAPDFLTLQKRLLSDTWFRVWRADAGCMAIFREVSVAATRMEEKLLKLKILELLCRLEHSPSKQEHTSYLPKVQMELARQVQEHLIRAPESYTSIERLAREYQVSSSQMQKVFKQFYGISIYQYLRNHRLERAAQALRETDRPVTEIALNAGFSNPGKFAGSFRERYGLPPQQYRQAQKRKIEMEQSCRNGVARLLHFCIIKVG